MLCAQSALSESSLCRFWYFEMTPSQEENIASLFQPCVIHESQLSRMTHHQAKGRHIWSRAIIPVSAELETKQKLGLFGLPVGSSLHRPRVDPVVVAVLLQGSGLGDTDVRNSLKPLKGLGFTSHWCYLWASLWLLLLYSGREAEAGPWSEKGCYQTKWDLLGDLSPIVPRGDCPAVEVQLIFSHLLLVMAVFQESAVALASGGEPSMQGNLEENSPAGHLFLPFCSQLLVHLISPGSPSKPQCVAAAGAPADSMTSPCQRLCSHCLSRGRWLYRGTWNPLSSKKSGWLGSADLFSLGESCLTLMTSCKFLLS